MRQRPGKDLDTYKKRFHSPRLLQSSGRKSAHQCLSPCCIRRISYLFGEPVFLLFWWKRLVEPTSQCREPRDPVHRSASIWPHISPHQQRDPLSQPLRSEGSRLFSLKKPTYDERWPRSFPTLPPLPYESRKITGRLEKRVKDWVISLPMAHRLPSHKDQDEPMYFLYHRKKGHTLEQWVPFREI